MAEVIVAIQDSRGRAKKHTWGNALFARSIPPPEDGSKFIIPNGPDRLANRKPHPVTGTVGSAADTWARVHAALFATSGSNVLV
jgi:hypothetical protein